MPKMKWDPDTGENRVFGDDEPAPTGWLDHHPEDPAYAGAPKSAKRAAKAATGDAAPMKRAEITAALKEGNVPFSANDKTDALEARLRAALAQVPAVAALGDGIAVLSTRELLARAKGE